MQWAEHTMMQSNSICHSKEMAFTLIEMEALLYVDIYLLVGHH